jgi:hypothetical protein
LCFEPGCHYAYRVDDRSRQRVADLAPEIRIAMTTADGKRYVELRPAPGPALGPDQFPPNWPPAGVE